METDAIRDMNRSMVDVPAAPSPVIVRRDYLPPVPPPPTSRTFVFAVKPIVSTFQAWGGS